MNWQRGGHEGVGSDIAPEYSGAADGSAVTKMPYVQLDITDKEAVEKVLTEIKPDVVVHCAAWTAVDLAEDDDKVEKVRKVNVTGTENIALACKKLDCKMVYLSTDYVFDGMGTRALETGLQDLQAAECLWTRRSLAESWLFLRIWRNISLSGLPGYLA